MSLADVEQAMMVGEGNRHVGETNMNEKSSRSHTILRMVDFHVRIVYAMTAHVLL